MTNAQREVSRFRSLAALLAAACCTVAAAPAAAQTASAVAQADSAAAVARADKAIAAGLAYLRSQQHADGFWGSPSAPPAVSALVLRSFAREGQAKDPAI